MACSNVVRPDDAWLEDATRSDSVATDGGGAAGAADDVITDWGLRCDLSRGPCNMVVNFCGDANPCAGIAQCAIGENSGLVAHAVCTSGRAVCAQADRCGDPSTRPNSDTCRCGRGPACPPGAICVGAPGSEPRCICLPRYVNTCQPRVPGVDTCGSPGSTPSYVRPASGRCGPADGYTCPPSDAGG